MMFMRLSNRRDTWSIARVDWPPDESRDQQAPHYFRTQKLYSNAVQFLRDSEFCTDLGVHLFQIRNYSWRIQSTLQITILIFFFLLYWRNMVFYWNNQQMQLYAVNFIPLLSSLYMFRAALRAWHPRGQVAVTTYANLWLYQWL